MILELLLGLLLGHQEEFRFHTFDGKKSRPVE